MGGSGGQHLTYPQGFIPQATEIIENFVALNLALISFNHSLITGGDLATVYWLSAVRKVDYAKDGVFDGLRPLHLDDLAATRDDGEYGLYRINSSQILVRYAVTI